MALASQMIAMCYSDLDLDQTETEYKNMLNHFQKADFEPLSSTRTELLAQAYFDISKFYIKKKRFGDAISLSQKNRTRIQRNIHVYRDSAIFK